jgi:hypothetical protein
MLFSLVSMRVRLYSANAMKITLKLYQGKAGLGYVDAACYHEDFAGVTTHKDKGKYQVKVINQVSIGDNYIMIYADPLERDTLPAPAPPEPVAIFSEPAAPPSPYVPGCEPLEEPSF